MNDAEIDDVLRRLARPPHPVDPALLGRITASVQVNVTPVKPLPPTWALVGLLLAVCTSVAAAGASWSGLDGIAALTPWPLTIDLASLGVLAVVLARESAVRLIPGSRPWLSAPVVVAGCWMALLSLFALVFRDYRADHFVAGLGCLEQGILHAIPAAILGALVLRRGFATRPVLAALVAGALAGLAGVVFLELHCSDTEAPHRLVWHAAVLPCGAALGALTAWVLQSRRPSVSRFH